MTERIFGPALGNSIAGLVGTVGNVYSAQDGMCFVFRVSIQMSFWKSGLGMGLEGWEYFGGLRGLIDFC